MIDPKEIILEIGAGYKFLPWARLKNVYPAPFPIPLSFHNALCILVSRRYDMAPHGRVENKAQVRGIDLHMVDVVTVTVHGSFPRNDTVGLAIDGGDWLLDWALVAFRDFLLDPVQIEPSPCEQFRRRGVFGSTNDG